MKNLSLHTAMGWSFAAYLAQFLTTFVGSVVAARLLTPVEMGIFGIGFAAYLLIAALQNLGLPGYIVQERELSPARLGTVYSLVALQSLLLATLVFVGTPLIAAFVRDARVTSILHIMALFALVNPIFVTQTGILQRAHRFELIAAGTLLRGVVSVAVTLVCAFNGFSSTSMAWGSVAGAAVAALFGLVVTRKLHSFDWTLSEWRVVWAYGSRILSTAVIANAFARSTDLIIGRLAGIAAVGYYGRATGIIDSLSGGLLIAFGRVVASALVEARDKLGRMDLAYVRMNAIVTGLFWPMLAGIALLSDSVIALLYGARWLTAAPVLSLLAVAAMIDVLSASYTSAFSVAGRVAQLPRIELARGLVSILLLLVSVRFGLIWIAVGRIASAIVFQAILWPKLRAAVGFARRPVLASYARSFIVTVAACGPAALLVWLEPPGPLPLHLLAAAIGAGVLLWTIALRLTGHELWPRGFTLTRRRKGGVAA